MGAGSSWHFTGQVVLGAQCPFAASYCDKSFFFFLLSATSLMTFLVSPYRDLSTQHVGLCLVSRFIVCHVYLCWFWHLPAQGMHVSQFLPGGGDSSLVIMLPFSLLPALKSCPMWSWTELQWASVGH